MEEITVKYSIADARNHLPSLIHSVEGGPPVEITRRGQSVAVLVSIDQWLALSSPKPDLWSGIERFRREFDREDLDIDDVYRDVRDRSTGRDPNF